MPQGSVINPVFFNVMVNDMFQGVGLRVTCSLFADDGAHYEKDADSVEIGGEVGGKMGISVNS